MKARAIDSTVEWLLGEIGEVVGGVEARRMFGGYGVYCEDVMFAIVYQGRVYLKVDDASRAIFEAEGSAPFRPRPAQALKSYYEVPAQVMAEGDRLREWAQRAAEVATRAKG